MESALPLDPRWGLSYQLALAIAAHRSTPPTSNYFRRHCPRLFWVLLITVRCHIVCDYHTF